VANVLLILRDEDVETVGSAITAIALQHGLEPVDPEAEAQDILSLAAALLGPRVVLAAGEDLSSPMASPRSTSATSRCGAKRSRRRAETK
jgi:hypothetical protein